MEVKDAPVEPEFPITLGGKEYKLTYPLTAIWAFEDISGIDILSGDLSKEEFARMKPSRRTKFVAQLCWAGLISKQPDLTFNAVASHINLRNLAAIDSQVSEAFFAYMPQKPEATNGDRPTQGNGQS